MDNTAAPKPENPYRDYRPFEFIGAMYGSQESKAPADAANAPKTLYTDDAIRKVSLAAIAKAGNFSYAVALEVRMMRDNTIASDSNFLLKGAAYISHIIVMPVLIAAVAIEAIVRKALSYVVNCFVMCRPPVTSTGSEKKEEVQDAKGGELGKAPEAKDPKDARPTLYERHVEFSGDMMGTQAALAASLSFGMLAVQDLVDGYIAGFNPFHDTFSIRPSMGATAPMYIPMAGSVIEGLMPVVLLTGKMFSEFNQNGQEHNLIKGKNVIAEPEVDLEGHRVAPGLDIPSTANPFVNPLFALGVKAAPMEALFAYVKPFAEDDPTKMAMFEMAKTFLSSGVTLRDYQSARAEALKDGNSLDKTAQFFGQKVQEKALRIAELKAGEDLRKAEKDAAAAEKKAKAEA